MEEKNKIIIVLNEQVKLKDSEKEEVEKLNADLKRLGEEKSDGEGKWEEKYKLLEGQFETETAKNGALEQGIKELKENIEELNKKLADQKVKEEKDALEASQW